MSQKTNSQKGQNLVEFAFVLPLGLVLLLGLIDLSYALYMANAVNRLSREGANLAARSGATGSLPARRVLDQMWQNASPPLVDISTRGCAYISLLSAGSSRATLDFPTESKGNCADTPSRLGERSGLSEADQREIFNGEVLRPGEQVALVEVFYRYQPITPFGRIGLEGGGYNPGDRIKLNSMATFFLRARPGPSPRP